MMKRHRITLCLLVLGLILAGCALLDAQGSAAPATRPIGSDGVRVRAPLNLFAAAMRPEFEDDLTALGPLSQYYIEITVDPDTATLTGQQTVHYVNLDSTPMDSITFRLYANLPSYGGQMVIRNVELWGKAATSYLNEDETALRIPLETPLPPGVEVAISMDFQVTVPTEVGEGYGQYVYTQDVMALANFYPVIPAYDLENCARYGNCDGGWPTESPLPYGDATFTDIALYEVLVTAPEKWVVAASGSTLSQGKSKGQVTWHLVSGPMRDFNLVLSPSFEIISENLGDIRVNSYYLPDLEGGGERVLRWSIDSLIFYQEHIGPYPFAEFDICATPTAAGGIEYPGLIVMPIRNYDQRSGSFQWATIHEVGHQWWYSLVGNDQQDEPWLDEALVQYTTALFYDVQYDWHGAVDEVFVPYYERVEGTEEDGPIDKPVAYYIKSNYGPLVYGKGPLFFHALHQQIGDEALYTILQQYFQTYRYQNANRDDLLDLIQEVSRQDLDGLYQEWLSEPG